ncbi:MAG: peptidylprolyl isomerase, partial [Nitrospinae bacterium]|nr:peptidylprolyl isomerase [Nitrospinota bacterium]
GLSFEEAARKYSEDSTAEKGGDVGYFTRKEMVKAFEDAAFGLGKGEMTKEPVKSFYGYHIIKVVDKKKGSVKSLEEAKLDIIEKLKKSEAKRTAKREAKKFIQEAKENYQEAVTKNNFQTEELTLAVGSIPEQAELTTLIQKTDTLKVGEFTAPIEFNNGYYVGRLKEIVPPQEPSLDSNLEEKVRAKLLDIRSKEAMLALVDEIKKELVSGKSLTEVALHKKLKIYDTGFIGKTGTIKEVDASDESAFKNSMFSLKKGESKVLNGTTHSYVIVLKEPVVIDEKEFEKEKELYKKKILSEKHDFIYKSWINNMKKKAEVKIHKSIQSAINNDK